jgi:hypothetical protein
MFHSRPSPSEGGEIYYMKNKSNISIQFFIDLRAQLNSQQPIIESARNTAATIRQQSENKTYKTNKIYQLRSFKFKRQFLK